MGKEHKKLVYSTCQQALRSYQTRSDSCISLPRTTRRTTSCSTGSTVFTPGPVHTHSRYDRPLSLTMGQQLLTSTALFGFRRLYTPIIITRKRYTLGSLIRPRAVTRCNLAVSGMYMRDFGKMHQIAYTYCSVGITDLKPLTGTSADQLPHRKSRSLATA